ncbi:MAG: ribonuclease Z [Bacteroidales bacterium]|jgi:ribonuclease Z|nr:ribonuclease Z [Bacteroidales bacterium]MCI2121220.1 ribonuclease Z [Bacteroidales bacterium]MCI2145990.1 ribonuclease Z [Bacteroidales bacterium]
MEFSLTTLGVASALPTPTRFPSAHVLNIHGRLFLIDCGEGTQIELRRYGFSFMKFDSIFISHLHGDHIFGLFGLLSTMSLLGRTAPLFIYAPSGFRQILDFMLKEFGKEFHYPVTHVVLRCERPTTIFETKTVTVSAFPLNHSVETYGFIFEENRPALNVFKDKIAEYGLTLEEIGTLKRGEDVRRADGNTLKCEDFTYRPFRPRKYAHCCDTAPFPLESEWIRGADLLYHEATFTSSHVKNNHEAFHSYASEAASVAKEAGVKKLVIGHYSSRYKDGQLREFEDEARRIFPETYLSKEGAKFDIPFEKYSEDE